VGDQVAARIEEGRPYGDIEDLVRRVAITSAQAEALATAGAFECFGLSRRAALWSAGAVAAAASPPFAPRLAGLVTGADAPSLPAMTPVEASQADLWATGLSPERYPTEFVRAELAAAGVVTAAGLAEVTPGERVLVAGVVTHRQRPATAQGVTFINLEDETGLINVICSAGVWVRYRRVARSSPGLVIDGRLERVETVINVVAERIRPLVLQPDPASGHRSGAPAGLRSRDFR
jgi:error-prone DNA polymerase